MMFFKKKKTNMELEILEQKSIIPTILANYIDSNSGEINLNLPENTQKIVIVASGSSYHCARFAVDLVEKFSKIETRAIYSSEFLLKNMIPQDENTLYVFITQSGETSDTLKAVERVKSETNLPTLCITNKENSTIWDACDYQVACHAGIENGIAATKSFTSQMLCLILISLKLIEKNQPEFDIKSLKESLFYLPSVVEKALEKRDDIKKLAKHLAKENVIVFTKNPGYCCDTVSIYNGYLKDNQLLKSLELHIWDDISFNAYSKDKNINTIDFDIDVEHPLYFCIKHLLGKDNKLIIDDDDTYQKLKKHLIIKKVNNIYKIIFINDLEKKDY